MESKWLGKLARMRRVQETCGRQGGGSGGQKRSIREKTFILKNLHKRKKTHTRVELSKGDLGP